MSLKGGTVCAYRGCSSRTGEGISLFSFPKDPQRSKIWLKACNRNDLLYKPSKALNKNYKLCEKHFEKECLWGGGLRKHLKDDAVPTLFACLPKSYVIHHEHDEPTRKELILNDSQEKSSTEEHSSVFKEKTPSIYVASFAQEGAIAPRKPRKCCVPKCPERFIKMHRFPKNDPKLFDIWLNRIKPFNYQHMTPQQIYEKYYVCNGHFSLDCLVQGTKRGLTTNAVPSINLPEIEIDVDIATAGNPDFIQLTPDKLKNKFLCHEHFRKQDLLMKNLAPNAVPLSSNVYKQSLFLPSSPSTEDSEENATTEEHSSVITNKAKMPSISTYYAREVTIEPSSELRRSWSLPNSKSLNHVKVLSIDKLDKNSCQSKCRVCLEKSNKIYPLQGPIINCDLDLYKMINYCIGDEMDLSEDLPQSVCLPCFKTIRICYNFIHEYKTNQETLLAARLVDLKFENRNTEYHQEHVDAVDLFTANQQALDQFEDNEEENLNFSSYESDENPHNKSKNHKQEELNIKFEHGQVENYDDDDDEQVEETIEETAEETILLDLIKQDNVEVEDEDAHELFQLPYYENSENNVIVSSVDIANPQDYFQSDNLAVSDNSNVSIVQSKVVQQNYVSNSTVESDHNYVSASENGVENKESQDNSISAVPVGTKFIPILPKVSQMRSILIKPLVQSNSPIISSKPLEVHSNIRLLSVKSNSVHKSDEKPLANTSTKTIILKKRCGSTKTGLNAVKRKIIIKRRMRLEDDSQQDETLDKTDNLSQQLSNKTSRRILLSYPCPKCPDIVFYGHEGKFRSHIIAHGNERMDCNKCAVKDLEPITFLEHFASCHRFECPECQKTFKNKHNLVTHLRKHLNIRHFCTYPNCTKSFAMPFALKKHLEEHTGEVTYPCKICGHISTTYDTHNYHVRMHGGRKFLCTQCGQTFLQASHLKAHMWKHTGKKCFKCDQCSNSYTSLGPLKKHKRKYHQ